MRDDDPAAKRPLAPAQGMSSRLAVGSRDDWKTPGVVLERVRRMDPDGEGDIMLDPCSTRDNPTRALSWYHLPEIDGLAADWACLHRGRGVCYVNFPYGQTKAWASKIAREAAAGCEVVSLVAAFFEMVWESAQAVCFWKGRLRFVGAPSSAPFPSCLVYHGPRPWRFEEAFADAGKVIRL